MAAVFAIISSALGGLATWPTITPEFRVIAVGLAVFLGLTAIVAFMKDRS